MSDNESTSLLPRRLRGESSYQSTDQSIQRNESSLQSNVQPRTCYKVLKIVATIIFIMILLLVLIGCVIFFGHKNAACSMPQVGAYTRSDEYSILYKTSTLACSDESIDVTVLLHNQDASVEIYRTLCQSIEKSPFRYSKTWNSTVNINVSQPIPVFSEDFSALNYFINGSIQVNLANITTNSSSVNTELCLFTTNDDYCSFKTAGANWKDFIKNAKCHSVQVTTGGSNSTTFHISGPTFAFVGIAATGFLSIQNLTVTTNGLRVSGPGENSTKVCQMNGKHTTCKFNVFNRESEEVCIIAHEDENSDGTYDYSNLMINFGTSAANIGFWTCLTALVILVAVCTVLVMWVIYKNRRQRKTTTVELNMPAEESNDQPPPTTNPAHGTQSSAEQVPAKERHDQSIANGFTRLGGLKTPTQETQEQPMASRDVSERDTQSSENDSRPIFGEPIPERRIDNPTQVVT